MGRDDAAVTMLYVAEHACYLAGADEKLIQEIDAPKMQTVVKRLATERIRSLSWEPEIELEEGMERTLEWVKTLDAQGAVAA